MVAMNDERRRGATSEVRIECGVWSWWWIGCGPGGGPGGGVSMKVWLMPIAVDSCQLVVLRVVLGWVLKFVLLVCWFAGLLFCCSTVALYLLKMHREAFELCSYM
jgi:hypothetical protein